jgi:hypothetical protein
MFSTVVVLLLLNKPPCTKAIQGQMWPAAANQDRTALQAFARSGTLEMCVSSSWRYKWQRVSIRKPI